MSDEDTDSDADDPSWQPEELPANANLRRSGRFAKKVNDVETVAPKSTSKGLTSEDLRNAKEMIRCPCCDYLAAFQSVLHDHYIAQHKIPSKNGCSECLLKFESTESFIDHFKYHEEGKLPSHPVTVDNGVTVTNNVEKPAAVEKPVTNKPTVQVLQVEPKEAQVETPMPPAPTKATFDEEFMKGVVRNISEANVKDPTSEDAQFIKIPYQAAIQDKGSKDDKQKKSFDELKSPNDLVEMKQSEKLKHFYKCAVYRCTFTSHDDAAFVQHVKRVHDSKMIRCTYCLQEFFSGEILVQHMMAEHSKRIFQCSSCFYRACSTKHLKTHIQHYHAKDVGTTILECEPVKIADNVEVKGEPDGKNTTWPYICAIGECVFQSFDPKQFRSHNQTAHRSVSVFFCHYCKVDFISFQRLLDHHRLHGLNALQCNYCIHGSETKEDILLHLCNAHADFPMKAFKRGLEDEVPESGNSVPHPNAEIGKTRDVSPADSPRSESPTVEVIEKSQTDFEELLYEVVGETYYPKYLKGMATDFLCGVQFCKEKFDSLLSYIGHLCNHHAAVNFPCPHCPWVSEDWKLFKNHLMCHGPDLFACGLVTCSFYDWNKQAVTDHLKSHTQSKAKVVIVREEESEDDDIDKVMSLPQAYSGKISKDPSYECLFCRFKCTDKNMMKNHLYEEVLYKRFCCSTCNTKHVSRKDIKNHYLEKHPDQDIKCSLHPDPTIENAVQEFLNLDVIPEESKAGQCGKCKKNFKAGFVLQRHVYLCTRKEYQPFDCNYCKSSFHDLKLLKFHMDEKHFRTPLAYTEVSSQLVEEALIPKLQQMRLELLKEALKGHENGPSNENVGLIKHYGCSACEYESNHKHNTQLHVENAHKGKAQVTKTLRNVAMPELSSSKEDAPSSAKPYRCGFCIKRLQSLEELEKHVEATHPVRDVPKYSYYYSPPDSSTADTGKYECSYCKSGEDTLDALRKHSQLMHAESPFRVRGYVSRDGGSAPVACFYCYHRVNDVADLKRHSATDHPGLPQKSVGGFAPRAPQKRPKPGDDADSSEEQPVNKRVRFSSSVFICTHCGAAFNLRGQVTAHLKKAHARLPTKFTEEAEGDRTFLQCEFCSFTGEQPSLDQHLSTKHRNRVTCGHCSRRFEFASRLKEHHDTAHPSLPVRYSQETFASAPPVKVTAARSPAKARSVAEPSKKSASPKKNLSKIMVNTRGLSIPEKKMSLAAFEEAYDIHPKVLLMRCNV